MSRAVLYASTILGALVTAYVGMPHVLSGQMNRDEFSLQSIYRSAVIVTGFGASAGYGLGMIITAASDRRRRDSEVTRYLSGQMRRADLPEDLRVAVAYLQQDLQDLRHK